MKHRPGRQTKQERRERRQRIADGGVLDEGAT
jgi:hypothetical protein